MAEAESSRSVVARPVIALVGAGQMGANHARVVHESPHADLGVVIDVDTSTADRVGSRYWARVSSALEAATSADAVIIASPSESHVDCALPFLELGKPVLIEKPFAPTLDDVDVLLDAAAKHDVPILCGFVERFNAAFRAAAEVLSEPPRHVMTMRHSPPAPRIRSSVVPDLLLHDLDLVLQLVPGAAVLQGAVGHSEGEHEHIDIADCVVSFEHGIASLSANRAGQRKVRTLSAHTSNELIEVDLLRQNVTVYRNVSQEIIRRDGGVGYRSSTEIDIPFVRHVGEPLALQFEHFLSLLSGRSDHTAEAARIRPPHELMEHIEVATCAHAHSGA